MMLDLQATARGAGFAAVAALALSLGSGQAFAAGGSSGSDGVVTWSTDGTSLSRPSNAVSPIYSGLDATGSQSARATDPGTGTTVDVYQDSGTGNSGYRTMQAFTPGSSVSSSTGGVYLVNASNYQDAYVNGSYTFSTPINYFGALINFVGRPGTQFGDISFFSDAGVTSLLDINPVADAYQTNVAANGDVVYSMYLEVTSTTGIANIQFAAVNSGYYGSGTPGSIFVSQQSQAVGFGGAPPAGSADVPEPGLMALGSLLGLVGIAAFRRRSPTSA